jgi:hypothetical protein
MERSPAKAMAKGESVTPALSHIPSEALDSVLNLYESQFCYLQHMDTNGTYHMNL